MSSFFAVCRLSVESSMMGDTFLEKIRRRIIGLNLRKKEEP